MGAPEVERFDTRDGVSIAYWVSGRGDAVIMCHGGPSTTHEYLVSDLGDLAGSATLVFHDYRGSGRSETAAPASYTFERLADDVDELREHLGFESVTVLAHSMGGFVALQYALRHPDRCRALILMSCTPAGTIGRTGIPTLRALGLARFARVLRRAGAYLAWWSWHPRSDAKTRARFSIMGTLQEGQPAFRAEVAAREILANNDNAPTLERLGFKTDLCSELSKIGCPALVIYGENDAPFAAAAGLFRAGLPQARIVQFAGVGHHPLVEEHDRTIRAISETLERIA